MIKNKFTELLKCLSTKEVSEFEHYLKGLFSRQKNAIALLQYLRKFHPEFTDSKKLAPDYIYKKIFKEPCEKPSQRKNLLNIFSDLFGHLKSFLIWKEAQKKSYPSDLLWLNILKEKRQSKKFLDYVLKMDAKDANQIGLEEHIKGFMNNYISYYFANTPHHPSPKLLENGLNYLEKFYQSAKLKLNCELANQGNAFTNYEHQQLPETFLAQPMLCELSSLYLSLYKSLTVSSIDNYYKVKSNFIKEIKNIKPEDSIAIISYLLNFTTIKIRQGNEEFNKESFELNKLGVEEGLFFYDGFFPASKFNNITDAACKAKKLDWAENFVDNHLQFIEEKIRDSIFRLCKARIFFEREKFEAAFTLLRYVKFEQQTFSLRAKYLIVRCAYELKEDQNFQLDFCNAFLRSLKSHKNLNPLFLEATANFLKLLRKLILGKISKEKLLEEIENTNPLHFDEWLLAKVKEG